MASESVVDQIIKSLSFEVEAVPQDQNVQATSSSNMTPMNVKIKVRKKHESDMEKGIISVQKSTGRAPERIRLISSDQTIMSFNVLMEAEFTKKGQRKPRKNFLGGCLGTYDDDDGPYVPSSTFNAKKDDTSISSKSEGVLKHNFTLLKHQRGKTEHSILGKCKPGGCLDPPYGEDKYSYKPVDKDDECCVYIPKEEIKEKSDKKEDPCKKQPSKALVKEKSDDDSVLRLKEKGQEDDPLATKYSDSIITYPPEVSSTQNIQDKFLRTRISSDEKQRKSTSAGSEIFYSPAKKDRSGSKDRKFSHDASSNNDIGTIGNRQMLRMTKKKKEEIPSDYENNTKNASLEGNLQEGTRENENISHCKENETELKSVYDTREDATTDSNAKPRSSSVISNGTKEKLKSKNTKTEKNMIHLVTSTSVPLAGKYNEDLTPNEKIKTQKYAREQITADENQNRDSGTLSNQEELTKINENIPMSTKISVDDYNKATEKEFKSISSESTIESKNIVKPHKYSLSREIGNDSKENFTMLNKLKGIKEPTSSDKEPIKYSESSEIFSSSDLKDVHSKGSVFDDPYKQNKESNEKPKITETSVKYTSADMTDNVSPKYESFTSLVSDGMQKRLSKTFTSKGNKDIVDDKDKRLTYSEENYNKNMENDKHYQVPGDTESYPKMKGISPELHSDDNFNKPLIKSNDSNGLRQIEGEETLPRRETAVSINSTSSLTEMLTQIKTTDDQFNDLENLQNKVTDEDDSYDHPLFKSPITKKQNVLENANEIVLPLNQDEYALRNNLTEFQSESPNYQKVLLNEQETLQDSKHLPNKYIEDNDDSVSNPYTKPTISTVDSANLSNHLLLRLDDTDHETTNIRDNLQVRPTKLLKNIGQSLEKAMISKYQDTRKSELTSPQHDLGTTYQSSAPPSVFGDNITNRDYDIYSKEYGEITSDITSQRSLDNFLNKKNEITTSLNDIHYRESSLISSMSSTSKPYENCGEDITKKYEDAPKLFYGKSVESKDIFSDKYKDADNENKISIVLLRSSLKNDSISLNFGFKSYENDKKERIIETFNTSNEPIQKPDDAVTVIKTLIRPQINNLRIPIDAENEMSIQIRKNKSPLKVQIEERDEMSTMRFNKLGGSKPNNETQDILNSIYERDLIPLQKAFKYLKRDLDTLASQKSKFKDKPAGPRSSKTTRVVKVKPKCTCCENW